MNQKQDPETASEEERKAHQAQTAWVLEWVAGVMERREPERPLTPAELRDLARGVREAV